MNKAEWCITTLIFYATLSFFIFKFSCTQRHHVITLLYCLVYTECTCNNQQFTLDHTVKIKVHQMVGEMTLNQITFNSITVVIIQLWTKTYIITESKLACGWEDLPFRFLQCCFFTVFWAILTSKDDAIYYKGGNWRQLRKPQQLKSDPGSKAPSIQFVKYTNKL